MAADMLGSFILNFILFQTKEMMGEERLKAGWLEPADDQEQPVVALP